MNTLRRLLQLVAPYRNAMALGMLLSLITLLANVALLALSGWFIASMALAGIAGVAINYFTPAAGIRGLAIARTVGRYGERIVTHDATLKQLAELRSWFYAALEPLAPAALQRYHSADLFSRIRADIDALDHFYLRFLTPIGVAAIALLILFVWLALYQFSLAVTALLLWLLAGVALPWWLYRRGEPLGRAKLAAATQLRSELIDGLQGMAELKVYAQSATQAAKIHASSEQLNHLQLAAAKLSGLSQAGLLMAANLALWLGTWLLIPAVNSGALTPTQLPMLLLLLLASFEAVMPLPLALQALGETLAAARRLFEIVDAEPAVKPLQAEPVSLEQPELVIKGVTLRYRETSPATIDNLSLRLKPGESLAILGESGAGKSSLINLLLRFWEYQQGEITLGGHDIRSLDSEQLRSQFAVVSQHDHLFNASVRQNLLLANSRASEAELREACRLAQIDRLIESLPEGYETSLGEAGVRLSGGEARRLAIARALLKPAPFLILDEPTEGLDSQTERELMDALQPLFKQRGVILITHKLVGLESVDQLLIMEQGQVVESGSPKELLRSGGRYQRLISEVLEESA